MGDNELEAIRARRMAELQEQMGGQQPNEKQKAEQAQREAEMKNSMLAQLLDQSARARYPNQVVCALASWTVNSIALVKPDKAKMIESMLIQMAQRGQIGSKIGEEQLKSLLEQVSGQTSHNTKVKFERRRMDFDDDDDDY